jgi:hypothetical protein
MERPLAGNRAACWISTKRRLRRNPTFPAMFNTAKDAIASQTARIWANKLISRYGKIQELKIDSRLKTLEVSCLLEGEVSPITVKINNYVVETEGDKRFIRAADFSCTRPWLQNFLKDHGPRHRVELPSWAAATL